MMTLRTTEEASMSEQEPDEIIEIEGHSSEVTDAEIRQAEASLLVDCPSVHLAKVTRRCTSRKTNGEPCPNWALKDDPYQKCQAHQYNGGRPVETSKFSKFMPERLRDRFEELMASPDYVSLKENIHTINLRIQELWARAAQHDSVQRRIDTYQAIKEINARIDRTLNPQLIERLEDDTLEDSERDEICHRLIAGARDVRATLRSLEESAHSERREDQCWEDLERFTITIGKLKETEVKRMVAANQVLTVTESYNLVTRLVSFIEEYVVDLETRAKGVRVLHQLLDRKGSK